MGRGEAGPPGHNQCRYKRESETWKRFDQVTGALALALLDMGYQVFPAQVEEHFCGLKDKVANCAVVGVEHEVFSEGIVAFVEKKPGIELDVKELDEHAKGIASYMRPLHYVILEPGSLPLNRVAKTDYVSLKKQAEEIVAGLRSKGGWDA